MHKVLFVCLGNICRSPTAQGVFQSRVDQAGLKEHFFVDSAGTAGWHEGKAPDPRTQKHALSRSYDLSRIQGRQVVFSDFEAFDHIIAMDKANLENLQAMCPEEFQHKLKLFLDFSDCPESEVPDPYFGGTAGFSHVLDLAESASEGLLNALTEEALA